MISLVCGHRIRQVLLPATWILSIALLAQGHWRPKNMIRFKQATVHKYKSFESDQAFDIESDVTILVGMNEPGKTSILEALAKSDYFEADEAFKINTTHD